MRGGSGVPIADAPSLSPSCIKQTSDASTSRWSPTPFAARSEMTDPKTSPNLKPRRSSKVRTDDIRDVHVVPVGASDQAEADGEVLRPVGADELHPDGLVLLVRGERAAVVQHLREGVTLGNRENR